MQNRSTPPPTEMPMIPGNPPNGRGGPVEVVVVEGGIWDLYIGKEESGVEMGDTKGLIHCLTMLWLLA